METVVPAIETFSSRRAVVDPQDCSELVVDVLRCGQCFVGWWRSNRFDAREGVGNNAVVSRNVLPYACSELGEKV
jgi:hypothetical protein